MFPGIYGFSWSAGNLIFLGAFYMVALTIATTFAFALTRAVLDFKRNKAEGIRWKADFENLPAGARACRHELTGEVKHRTCENAFACGECRKHPMFLKAREAAATLWVPDQSEAAQVFGLEMPLDRMYHRGHTWVQPKRDGTMLVGLDDFGLRLTGRPDAVALPPAGTRLQANGTACRISKGSSTIRILSPVDGEVVETHRFGRGWLLRLKPLEGCDTRHLLQGAEVRPWILREVERLQLALSAEGVGLSLADGGEVVSDVPSACPNADWPQIWSETFLES